MVKYQAVSSQETNISMAQNMSQSQDAVLSNIRQYAAKARETHEEHMDVDASRTEARLENTVKELQAQVEAQKAALESVRGS